MIKHEITVFGLIELLVQLKAMDVLIPNDVQNLAIHRDGTYVGFIDLAEGDQCVRWFKE